MRNKIHKGQVHPNFDSKNEEKFGLLPLSLNEQELSLEKKNHLALKNQGRGGDAGQFVIKDYQCCWCVLIFLSHRN